MWMGFLSYVITAMVLLAVTGCIDYFIRYTPRGTHVEVIKTYIKRKFRWLCS